MNDNDRTFEQALGQAVNAAVDNGILTPFASFISTGESMADTRRQAIKRMQSMREVLEAAGLDKLLSRVSELEDDVRAEKDRHREAREEILMCERIARRVLQDHGLEWTPGHGGGHSLRTALRQFGEVLDRSDELKKAVRAIRSALDSLGGSSETCSPADRRDREATSGRCIVCGRALEGRRPQALTCSPACRREASRIRAMPDASNGSSRNLAVTDA